MRTILEYSDVKKLNEDGFFFVKKNTYKDINSIRDPYHFDQCKMVIDQSNIFTERNPVNIEDNMKRGNVKCINISNPKVYFKDSKLNIEFETIDYKGVIDYLNREYNLKKILD